jgi:predicted DNA binding CopG/RHH family protein
MAKQGTTQEITKTTMRLPKSLVIAAKHRAIDDGIDFQDIVIRALEQYLGKKGGKQ